MRKFLPPILLLILLSGCRMGGVFGDGYILSDMIPTGPCWKRAQESGYVAGTNCQHGANNQHIANVTALQWQERQQAYDVEWLARNSVYIDTRKNAYATTLSCVGRGFSDTQMKVCEVNMQRGLVCEALFWTGRTQEACNRGLKLGKIDANDRKFTDRSLENLLYQKEGANAVGPVAPFQYYYIGS